MARKVGICVDFVLNLKAKSRCSPSQYRLSIWLQRSPEIPLRGHIDRAWPNKTYKTPFCPLPHLRSHEVEFLYSLVSELPNYHSSSTRFPFLGLTFWRWNWMAQLRIYLHFYELFCSHPVSVKISRWSLVCITMFPLVDGNSSNYFFLNLTFMQWFVGILATI